MKIISNPYIGKAFCAIILLLFQFLLVGCDISSHFHANLVNNILPDNFAVKGLSATVDTDGLLRHRWALGPETIMAFILSNEKEIRLHLAFNNPIRGQQMDLEINGQIIKQWTNIPPHKWLNEWVDEAVSFSGKPGVNTIVFKWKDWNHNRTTFAPNDPRPLSVTFFRLRIVEKPSPMLSAVRLIYTNYYVGVLIFFVILSLTIVMPVFKSKIRKNSFRKKDSLEPKTPIRL